jgi:hypothetical protein
MKKFKIIGFILACLALAVSCLFVVDPQFCVNSYHYISNHIAEISTIGAAGFVKYGIVNPFTGKQVQTVPVGFNKAGATKTSYGNEQFVVTPAQKMIAVNNDLGNPGIALQQGSSRVIYDSLPLDATSFNLRFFESVQTRSYPRTNISQNRLPPGEAIVIQRMYFYAMVMAVSPTVTATNALSVGAAGLYQSIISVNIAQNEVIKKFSLTSMQSQFNKNSKFSGNDVIVFDNYLIIPPQLEFTVDVQTPTYAAVGNNFLVCALEGLGSLLAPKSNF